MPEPGLFLGTLTRDEATKGWENKGQLLDGWIHATTAPLYPLLSFTLGGGEMDSARNEGMGKTQ